MQSYYVAVVGGEWTFYAFQQSHSSMICTKSSNKYIIAAYLGLLRIPSGVFLYEKVAM